MYQRTARDSLTCPAPDTDSSLSTVVREEPEFFLQGSSSSLQLVYRTNRHHTNSFMVPCHVQIGNLTDGLRGGGEGGCFLMTTHAIQ